MRSKIYFSFFLFLASCQTHRIEQQEKELVTIQITDQNGLSETISSNEKLAKFSQVNFLDSQPYKKVLRFFKRDQEGKSHSVITSYYPNGQVEQYLEGSNTTAHGPFRKWHPNGQLYLEVYVIGGPCDLSPSAQLNWLFDGESKVYDEEGKMVALLNYQKGKLEGRSFYYYPDGSIRKLIDYKADKVDGEKITYFDHGKLKKKRAYKNGKKDGVAESFFFSGEKRSVEEYEKGRLLRGVYFDNKGEMISEIVNGFGKKAQFVRDKIHKLVTYQKGESEGLVEIFSDEGALHKSYVQKQGKKQGIEIEYYITADGLGASTNEKRKKIQVTWDDDSLHGIVQTWYLNGKMQSEREMSRNQKNGRFLGWYEDGSIMFVEEYESDLLIKGAYYKKGQPTPLSTVRSGTGVAYLYEGDGAFIRKIKYQKGKAVE